MIGFIIGFVLGGWFGVCLICVAQMAREEKDGKDEGRKNP